MSYDACPRCNQATEEKGKVCHECNETESRNEALTEYIMGTRKLSPVERLGHIKGDWYEWHVVNAVGQHGSSQGNHDFSFNSGEFEPDQS